MTNTVISIQETPSFLKSSEAARLLRVSTRTLRAYRHRGHGPAYAAFGGVYRCRRADIDAFVASSLKNN